MQTKVIGTEVIFVDPGVGQWGLKNFLVAIGGDVIEVVSPIQPNTTAGRLLSKRGDGGYMIIMQTVDALARKSYIEFAGLGKVIFCHETEDSVCVQYHPKGLRGGVIAELDSHHTSPSNPDPLNTRFSPWHACGPTSTHPIYAAGMKRHADLHLLGATLRLKPRDEDIHGAAKQWEDVLGVKAQGQEVVFTNATMEFVNGVEGQPEGIVEIRIGVEGRDMLRGIFERAEAESYKVDEKQGAVEMLGVRFVFVEVPEIGKSRL